MNSKKNAANGRLLKLVFGVLAVVLFGSVSAERALAQTDIIQTNGFSAPVAKVVPNPCTGGAVLITGSQNVSITTTQSSTGGFNIKINFSSSGTGQDALADGTLITDGTQQPKYNYSSAVNVEVNFPTMPSYFMITVPIRDYLQRELVTNPNADALTLKTGVEITFSNGVPTVPIVRSLNVSCN